MPEIKNGHTQKTRRGAPAAHAGVRPQLLHDVPALLVGRRGAERDAVPALQRRARYSPGGEHPDQLRACAAAVKGVLTGRVIAVQANDDRRQNTASC